MLFSSWSKVGGCIVLSVQVDNRMVCGRVSMYAVKNCFVRELRSVISVSSSGKRNVLWYYLSGHIVSHS